jgi:hypothetical protein
MHLKADERDLSICRRQGQKTLASAVQSIRSTSGLSSTRSPPMPFQDLPLKILAATI